MNQVSCGKCGKSAEISAKFCPECGAPLAAGTPEPNLQSAADLKETGSRKSTGARDSLIVIGLLVVVTISFFIFKSKAERPVDPSTQAAAEGPHGGQMSMEMLEGLPTDYLGLVASGNKFYDEGSFAVAAEVYSRALAIDDDSPDVRTDYGACLYAMGLPERAAEEFRAVVRTHPEHSITNFNLGVVYHSLKLEDSARFYWERYLELDPNGPPAATARELLKELDT